VANRNKGGRVRSRKRRSKRPGAQAAQASSATAGPEPEPERKRSASEAAPKERSRSRLDRAAERSGKGLTGTLALGERPRAPWHPLPLSELLILIGAIGTVVGLARRESGIPLLLAGLAAVLIGTVEVTLREHRSGYRSHTLMLTLLPAIAVFTGVLIIVRPPAVVNLVLLALDAAVAVLLFKRLRAQFLRARHERAFAAKR
jgi:hypothetical protein